MIHLQAHLSATRRACLKCHENSVVEMNEEVLFVNKLGKVRIERKTYVINRTDHNCHQFQPMDLRPVKHSRQRQKF